MKPKLFGTLKPNLLGFTNHAILSPGNRASYNLNTGEQNPDTGWLVSLREQRRNRVDEETVREFWRGNSDLLTEEHAYLSVWWDGKDWVYSVARHTHKKDDVLNALTETGLSIWDNQTGEML